MKSPVKVLCVDDEASFLELAKLLLEKGGSVHLDVAISAMDALRVLEEKDYDVVVSDFSMPGMDGIALLKALRARGDDTPFIMFTGKGREEVAMEALNSGADLYIQKGTSIRAQFAELTMMIQKLAQHRRAELKSRNEKGIGHILVDAEIVALVGFDKDLVITMWNRGAERVSGFSKDDMIGTSVSELLPFIETEGIQSLLDDVLSGKQVGVGDIRFSDPETGLSGHLKAYASPTIDENGSVTGGFAVLVDTSEERSYQDALRDTREDYGALFNGAADAIFVHTLDGRFQDVNEAACKSLGYTREELLQMTPEDITDPESASKVSARMQEAIKNGYAFFEVNHIAKDGTRIPTELNVRALRHRGQTAFLAIARDLTWRKAAENALRQSEEFSSMIFSSIQDGISILDQDLTVQRVNSSMEEWYSHSMPLVGKKCYEIHQHRDEPCEECPARWTLETGKAGTGLVTKIGANGEVVGWLDVFTFPLLREGTNEMEGVIEYLRDATERIKAQEALKASEEKYRQLALLSSEGIVRTDANGVIVFANPRIAEITGYSVDELLGKSIFNFVDAKNAQVLSEEIAARTKGGRGHYDVEIIQCDGTPVSVSIGASPLLNESGQYLGSLATLVDMTKRKETEVALMKANEKLRLLDAITRHDIVNQLVVLSGYLEMAWGIADEEKPKEYLARMKEAAMTINDQLEFAKDYQAAGSKAPEWIDAKLTLDSVLASIELEKIAVESNLDGLELWADPMLEKTFLNLVDNTKRHGERATKIRFSFAIQDDTAVIVIEDDGLGIPDGEKEKIFERGYGKNTGLGLFLIREVLSITDFSISETGQAGAGARFEIVVPKGRFRLRKS
ncbi:MAG: PAS domain S-box protein [Thermoplasmata archaeon]|nr:PAS domain S-box protein [Thermoplasmata archaeon]